MHEIDCTFCSVHETERFRVIRSIDTVTSLLSVPRLARGHTLVVPKRHLIQPEDLTGPEIVAIHREADRLSKVMFGQLACRGVLRLQKTQPEVPEGKIKQNHLHLHVLPGSPGDPHYDHGFVWGDPERWLEPTAEEIEEMKNKLRIAHC